MALRRPRRVAAGVAAVRRAADAHRRAGRELREVWLPGDDDVLVRRVQIALEAGAKARIFVLNAAHEYGRTELEVSLAEGADFELYGANIGTGLSTNEIVTNVKHVGVGGRSRQVDPHRS